MITVKLVRTGRTSSHFFSINKKAKGAFYKNFKTVEDLVKYFYEQNRTVAFYPGFELPEEYRAVFEKKIRARVTNGHKHKNPALERKYKKLDRKCKERYGGLLGSLFDDI